MPWRKTKDPYAVFVSEFMLQQTTVATVRPFYDRFVKRFPTLASLAGGDLNDVLALWSGLGYYARARNLWSAMRLVRQKFSGKIPSDLEKLQELPGVGPYTAAAIASFAFNRPAAVLDGNVIRLLMRLLAIEDDPKLKAAQEILKKVALDFSLQGESRDINLALMDLGSSVCLPKSPRCEECPVSDFCLAKRYGRQADIPLKSEVTERPTVRRLHAVIQHRGAWLFGQRPLEGLFGGLWEFPGTDAPAGVEPVNFLEEAVRRETGLKVRVREALNAFEHQLSHRVFSVRSFLCEPAYVRLRRTSAGRPVAGGRLRKKGRQYRRFRWVSAKKLSRLGISSITKRIINEFSSRFSH